MPRRTQTFQTIRSEGAVLPPDILQAIASLKVDGLTPDAYHLPPGTKLNEAISRSWQELLKHWKAFREARALMPESELTGTAVTNERWLLPLFNGLDYGRLPTSAAPEIDGRRYPIERFYNHAPIHLIGCKLPLDRRTPGARGAATASPHSMLQEFLNRDKESLWGFLSNGLRLRLLRDNASLSRLAYIEFDLEAMMEGEVYADFALLWLVCHQSRIEAARPHESWLERWSGLARERGTRVLEDLRDGVTKAIETLGHGFIAHPRNDRLRARLHSGELSGDDYYRQLLRVVYRLLFLFVAEDRELLHDPQAATAPREVYDEHYSARRLRELSYRMRGSKHADLWSGLSLVFDALGRPGCPELGLPALGSFLWRRTSTADLAGPGLRELEVRGSQPVGEPTLIANDDLLAAVRALAYVEQNRVLRAVDYRNLGSEELGSVYESLLELHPEMNAPGRTFSLTVASGHERKTTGSYYTPDSLVQCLLDSTLEPVVAERIKGKKSDEAAAEILRLTVCDPACGSGHFLIAAAHRLARHLARLRSGEAEPTPDHYQLALRDVIGHSVYGVDINPMAVELCKVALWMEAIEPGKPLSFLDHHIQCGNSLLGATPALLAKGIPDEAFTPIEGDDKKLCAEYKKQNRDERRGQKLMFTGDHRPWERLGDLGIGLARLDAMADDTPDAVRRKEDRYAELVQSTDYLHGRFWADVWCAAFVWKKTKEFDYAITEDVFRRIERNPHDVTPWMRDEIRRLAEEYQFFHWHLAFPAVFRVSRSDEPEPRNGYGCTGGFDVVLGNPPWERVTLKEKEWFQLRDLEIAAATNGADRARRIEALRTRDERLYCEYAAAKRHAAGEKALLRTSGLFPLCGTGDVNTFAVFAEQARRLMRGYAGLVLPTGIVTTETTQAFVAEIIRRRELASILDFDNRAGIFPSVQGNVRFCLLTLSRDEKLSFSGAAQLTATSELNDPTRIWTLDSTDLFRINPNTLTLPLFTRRRDTELLQKVFVRLHCLDEERSAHSGRWTINLRRMFHMGDDSHLFNTEADLLASNFDRIGASWVDGDDIYLPLMEAKLTHQFDHRAGTFAGTPQKDRFGTHPATREVSEAEHQNPVLTAEPRYWVHAADVRKRIPDVHYLFGFRDTVSAVADSRSLVATVMPAYAAGHTLVFLFADSAADTAFLLSWFNSFANDYVFRLKASGAHASFFHIRQLPVPGFNIASTDCLWDRSCITSVWVLPRVLELTYSAWDLEPFARASGYSGPPFCWNKDRRFLLRAELDAAFFHLYGIERADVDYIMETFPIVKRKDVERHGDYRTKRVILEIYDQLAEAIRTGQPYQTRLDPPPADPRVAHPPRDVPVPALQEIELLRVNSYIVLLLRTWNKPAARNVLEAALVLMLNDTIRQRINAGAHEVAKRPSSTGSVEFVRGLDGLLAQLQATGFIHVDAVGQRQVIRLGAMAPPTDRAPPPDKDRVEETLRALAILGEDRALNRLIEVTSERYVVVS